MVSNIAIFVVFTKEVNIQPPADYKGRIQLLISKVIFYRNLSLLNNAMFTTPVTENGNIIYIASGLPLFLGIKVMTHYAIMCEILYHWKFRLKLETRQYIRRNKL